MSLDFAMPIQSFEEFLEAFNVPQACKLDKPIFKKMLLDTGALDTADKIALKDDVDKIRWLHTLKPNTINISAYQDDDCEYAEIAILQIQLIDKKRQERIAKFFNKAIPYPLVLFFTYTKDDEEQLSISLTEKRINHVDHDKWVLEQVIHTDWITLSEANQRADHIAFINQFNCHNFPFTNFWDFYQALISQIVALQCAEHTGTFQLGSNKSDTEQPSYEERRAQLQRLHSLEEELNAVRNLLKKEVQMNAKMRLNVEAKKIKDTIAAIKEQLSEKYKDVP